MARTFFQKSFKKNLKQYIFVCVSPLNTDTLKTNLCHLGKLGTTAFAFILLSESLSYIQMLYCKILRVKLYDNNFKSVKTQNIGSFKVMFKKTLLDFLIVILSCPAEATYLRLPDLRACEHVLYQTHLLVR